MKKNNIIKPYAKIRTKLTNTSLYKFVALFMSYSDSYCVGQDSFTDLSDISLEFKYNSNSAAINNPSPVLEIPVTTITDSIHNSSFNVLIRSSSINTESIEYTREKIICPPNEIKKVSFIEETIYLPIKIKKSRTSSSEIYTSISLHNILNSSCNVSKSYPFDFRFCSEDAIYLPKK